MNLDPRTCSEVGSFSLFLQAKEEVPEALQAQRRLARFSSESIDVSFSGTRSSCDSESASSESPSESLSSRSERGREDLKE